MSESFRIGDRVVVYWEESGCKFLSTIHAVNKDKSYDVLYDELVQGKQCIERLVPSRRITLIDLKDATSKKVDDSTSSKSVKQQGQHYSSSKKMIRNLLARGGTMEDVDAENTTLSNADFVLLHDSLTIEKLQELLESDTTRLKYLSRVICERSQALEDNLNIAFAETDSLENSGVDSQQKFQKWITELKQADDGQLIQLHSFIACASTILRLLAISIWRNQHTHSLTTISNLNESKSASVTEEVPPIVSNSQNMDIPEELIEKSIRTVQSFVTTNVLRLQSEKSATESTSTTPRSRGKSLKTQEAKADAFQRKYLIEVGNVIIPMVLQYLKSLEMLLSSSRQSERVSICISELVFAVLKCDPATVTTADLLEKHTDRLIFKLQKNSIPIYRLLFVQNPGYHQSFLIEHIGLLSQTHVIKAPTKPHPIQCTKHSAVSTRHVSVSFLALLTSLQSVVDVSSGISTTVNARKKSTASVSEIGPKDADFSKTSLLHCYKCCSIFVCELFKRCSLKEESGDYRTITSNVIDELLISVQSPTWPISSMLLEQFIYRIVSQLNSSVLNSSNKTSSTAVDAKRDASYVVFLIELLGSITVGIRRLTLIYEQEREKSNAAKLSDIVKVHLMEKLLKSKGQWLALAQETQMEVVNDDTMVSIEAQPKKRQSKKAKAATALTATTKVSTSAGKKGPEMIDLSNTLKILSEIRSLTVDAIADQPHCGKSLAGDDEDCTVAPAPLDVLVQLEQFDDLIRKLSVVSATDFNHAHVSQYLQHQFMSALGSLTPTAIAANSAYSGSLIYDKLDTSEDYIKDAYYCTLSLWHKDAVFKNRKYVAEYVFGELSDFVSAVDRPNALKTSSRIELKSSDTAWRDNYSIEAVQIAHRAVLTERSFREVFEGSLQCIILLFSDSLPAVRAKAVKSLAFLLQLDENLILRDALREAITIRLMDKAISVREEAVKLIGSFIISGYKDLSEEYFEGLRMRLYDEGISVRKSVVTILREILLNQPSHAQYTELCVSLLQKLSDVREEDTVKDIIRATFQLIWFTPPTQSTIQSFSAIIDKNRGNESVAESKDSGLTVTSLPNSIPRFMQSMRLNTAREKKAFFSSIAQLQADGFDRRPIGNPTSVSLSSLGQLQYLPDQWKEISPEDVTAMRSIHTEYDSALLEAQQDSLFMDSNTSNAVQRDNLAIKPVGSYPLQAAFMSPMGDIFNSLSEALQSCGLPSEPTEYYKYICNLVEVGPVADSDELNPPNNVAVVTDQGENVVTMHIETTAAQLVNIASITAANEWMVSLLREVLHGKAEGAEAPQQVKQRRSASFTHCEKLVASLIEQLLKTEENDPKIMKKIAARNKEKGSHLTDLVVAIAFFCEAHPPFISKHLLTLLPYLKGDPNLSTELNSLVCLKITEILSAAATLSDVFSASFNANEVISSLTHIALSYSSKNANAAIGCLSLLIAHFTNDASPLFALADKCFKALQDIARGMRCVSVTDEESAATTSTTTKSSNRSISPAATKVSTPGITPTKSQADRLQRCLIVLGYVCEHVRKCIIPFREFGLNFKPDIDSFMSLLRNRVASNKASDDVRKSVDEEVAAMPLNLIEILHPQALFGCCYAACKFALQHQNLTSVAVQVRAVQALCCVFAGCPRMMLLDSSSLIANLLKVDSDGYDEAVHDKFLLSLKDMMVAEEKRLEKGAALNLMKESGVNVSLGDHVLGPMDADSDATIAGFVLQQHFNTLVDSFLFHKNASLRRTTLQLVGTLLRQGMLCPLDVISAFIALQGDIEPEIRSEALKMLQMEDERHPTFLDNRLVQGLETACSFQTKVFGCTAPTESSLILLRNSELQLTNEPLSDTIDEKSSMTSIFVKLYRSCIQSNKRRRVEFLGNVLRRSTQVLTVIKDSFIQQRVLLTSGGTGPVLKSSARQSVKESTAKPVESHAVLWRSGIAEAVSKLSVAEFFNTTLAYLNYDSVEEPLQIVYRINRTVPVSMGMLLDCIKKSLAVFGISTASEESPQKKAAIATPSKSSHLMLPPTTTPTSAKPAHTPKEIDPNDHLVTINSEHVIQLLLSANNPSCCLCLLASLFELMSAVVEARGAEASLRLKAYLKCAYGLTDDRCLSFNPDTPSSSSTSVLTAAAEGEGDSRENAALVGAKRASAVVDASFLYSASASEEVVDYKVLLAPSKLAFLESIAVRAEAPKSCALLWSEESANRAVQLLTVITADYNRMASALAGDPADFTLCIQKKKETARSGSHKQQTGTATAAKGRPKKPQAVTPAKKRKRATKSHDEDDDGCEDEDDEDYEVAVKATKSVRSRQVTRPVGDKP